MKRERGAGPGTWTHPWQGRKEGRKEVRREEGGPGTAVANLPLSQTEPQLDKHASCGLLVVLLLPLQHLACRETVQ